MHSFTYPIQLTVDPEGGFVVSSRDLPEVITQGETHAEAIEAAEGALQAALEMRIQDHLPIPPASALQAREEWVAVPIVTALKAALHLTMREQGFGPNELAQHLGGDELEANRLLKAVNQGQIPALEVALHRLGKRPELRVA